MMMMMMNSLRHNGLKQKKILFNQYLYSTLYLLHLLFVSCYGHIKVKINYPVSIKKNKKRKYLFSFNFFLYFFFLSLRLLQSFLSLWFFVVVFAFIAGKK